MSWVIESIVFLMLGCICICGVEFYLFFLWVWCRMLLVGCVAASMVSCGYNVLFVVVVNFLVVV